MSRVGNKPISIPENVEVTINNKTDVHVKGQLGSLNFKLMNELEPVIEGKLLKVEVNKAHKQTKLSIAMWGTSRNILNNMVTGVSKGFTKHLIINGVGCRASIDKNILSLSLGKSHEFRVFVPEGIKVVCPKPTEVVISSHDNQKLGDFAAKIRKLYLPEPYKGKGIRYHDEVIRRKEGKKK